MQRSPLLALVTSLVLASSAVAQPPPQKSEGKLKAIVEQRPTALEPYADLARLYRASGRIDEAEGVLRIALTVHPDSNAVFDQLTRLYATTQQTDKTLAIAREWIAVAPANPQPYMIVSSIRMERAARLRDHPVQAIAEIDGVLELLKGAGDGPQQSPLLMVKAGAVRLKSELTTDPVEREALFRESQELFRAISALQQSSRPAGGIVGGAAGSSTWSSSTGSAPRVGPVGAVRVGGNIKQPTKIKDARPIMPAEAIQAGVQGVVILEVVIDESGTVSDAKVLRSIPILDRAAVDAVRQWEFTQTLLNGTPVRVIMTVTVQFTLP
jgi:TonB family protein